MVTAAASRRGEGRRPAAAVEPEVGSTGRIAFDGAPLTRPPTTHSRPARTRAEACDRPTGRLPTERVVAVLGGGTWLAAETAPGGGPPPPAPPLPSPAAPAGERPAPRGRPPARHLRPPG